MFAVIRTGGKQYKVSKNDEVSIEHLVGDPGSVIKLDEVLMIGENGKPPTIGSPIIEKAGVFAEIIEQKKSQKVLVFKKKRRQNYRRTKGHRQLKTLLKILEVSPTGEQTLAKSIKAKKKPVEAKDPVGSDATKVTKAKVQSAKPKKIKTDAKVKSPEDKKGDPSTKKVADKKVKKKKV